MQKRITRIFVSLFLISVLTGIMMTNVGQVKANPDMSINADGSITQSGSILQLSSNVSGVITYVFTANISDHIAIYRSNVVIDGRGWFLIGTGSGDGFVLEDGVNHVQIGNLTILSFDTAIRNQGGSGNQNLGVANATIQGCNRGVFLLGGQSGFATITNNTFSGDGEGIYDYYGAGNSLISGNIINATTNCIEANTVESNTIIGNVMNSNNNGISLTNDVSNTIISGNNISTGTVGIDASYGANDTLISGNTFSCASAGIDLGGGSNGWSSNDTVTGNNIYASQNPTVMFTYVRNSVISQNTLITRSSNIVSFDHANNNRITNNNLTSTVSTGYCMNIYDSNYTYISNNSMYSSAPTGTALSVGIKVSGGYYNTLVRNTISNPNGQGITLDIAYYNTVSQNTITMYADQVGPTGIWFTEDSAYNEVKNNSIYGRNDVNSTTIGMQINSGASNNIIQNNVSGNRWGFYLGSAGTTNNNIIGNNITSNGVGVKVVQSSGNYLYSNNFLANGVQVETDTSANNWNTILPSGGNYWSDYAGVDANHDGIGDTPYIINAYNQDNYPLMNPWTQPSNGYLVVRGGDNRIYYRLYNGTTASWYSWNSLPTGTTMDAPAAACADKLYCVVRGSDGGSLWFSALNQTDGTFSGWTQLSGSTPSPPSLSSNGTALALTVRGQNNVIYYRIYTIALATWSGWSALPSGSTLDATAASLVGNTLHVVVRGSDGSTIWYSNIDPNTAAFSGWSQLSGSTPSTPTLTANNTALALAVRGGDNRIYYCFYTIASHTWTGWAALPSGTTLDTTAATTLQNSLYFVVRGSDGTSLWTSSMNMATSAFSGWTLLSGSTPSKPTLTG